jgi:2-iminobutanoate/2-iminopropanoate deaminase
MDNLPFSESLKAGQLLFISGQIGVDGANPSFEQEVRQTMTNIGEVLQRQGLNYSNLVQVTIYLTDIGDYAAMNHIYAGYFQGSFPTRATIAVKELALKARIEISAIALLPA